MTLNLLRKTGGKGLVMPSLILSVLVASVLVLLPAAKAGSIPPDPDRRELQLGKRTLTISGDDRYYEVRSSKVVDGVEDSFKVELRIAEDLEIALKYKESATKVEHRIDVSLRLKELVEFKDRNGDGAFEPQEKVSSQIIDNRSMGPIEYKVEDNLDYGLIHVLSTSAMDRVFSVRFYMTADLASITGDGPVVNITPSEMKFDIDIKDYPYKQNDTRLALDARIVTREIVDQIDQTIDESINIASDESGFSFNDADNITGAFFTWSNSVQIDGRSGPVIVDILQDGLQNETRRLTLNYPRGDRIFHDPKIGIVVKEVMSRSGTDKPSELSSWLLAFGIIAIVVIIVLVMTVAIYTDNRRFREEASHRDPFELKDYSYYKGKGG